MSRGVLIEVKYPHYIYTLTIFNKKHKNKSKNKNKTKTGRHKDSAVPFLQRLLNKDENHDLAIARSSSSRADPGLRVAFKCLNV